MRIPHILLLSLLSAGALSCRHQPPERWHPSPPPSDDAIYFVLVDRFADGDPSNNLLVDRADPQAFHGGDLQGILQHLDELQALGVRTLWLSPISATRHEKFFEWGAFHGYWVRDVGTVDPVFGTEEDLRQLSDALHARGMRLVLDVVLNHVAMDDPLTREKPAWFHHEGGIQDWNDPVQRVRREVHGLPDLAQENPEVYQWLLDRSLHLVEIARPDGFRIDAVRHMPLEFIASLAADLRERTTADFFLLGEDFEGDALGLSRTFQAGSFSAMFDFPLHYAMTDVFCHDRPLGRLAATLSQDSAYPDPSRMVTFLDNHDLPRIRSECGGSVERVEQALAFMLASRGIPAITYGTEAGLEGAKEPDNRADMRFGVQDVLGEALREGLALRRAHPALRSPTSRVLTLEPELLVMARLDPSEVAILAINRSREPRSYALPPELARLGPARREGSSESCSPQALILPPNELSLFFLEQAPGILQAPPDGDKPRKILLRLSDTKLPPGEQLYLVGAGARLGNWTPDRALGPVSSTPGSKELLEATPGEVLEYKLILRSAEGAVRWAAGENQYLLVQPGEGPIEIELRWPGP